MRKQARSRALSIQIHSLVPSRIGAKPPAEVPRQVEFCRSCRFVLRNGPAILPHPLARDSTVFLPPLRQPDRYFTVAYDWVRRFNGSGFANFEQVRNLISYSVQRKCKGEDLSGLDWGDSSVTPRLSQRGNAVSGWKQARQFPEVNSQPHYWHYALDVTAIVSISKPYFPPGEATRRPLKFAMRECAI